MSPSFLRRTLAGGMAALITATVLPGVSAAAAEPPAPAASPAQTAPAFTKEQAIALIQEHFQLPPGGTLTANLVRQAGGMSWDVRFEPGDGRTLAIALVDSAKGQLMDLLLPDARPVFPVSRPAGQALRPRQEAQAAAWDLLTKLYPDDLPDLKLVPEGLGARYPHRETYEHYNFTWVLHHQSIPVMGQYVTVSVDKVTGHVVALERRISEKITYKSSEPKASATDAAQRFAADFQPALEYQPRFTHYLVDGEPSGIKVDGVSLVYSFEQAYWLQVDAESGQLTEDLTLPAVESVPDPAEPPYRPELPLDIQQGANATGVLFGLAPGTQLSLLQMDPKWNDGRTYLAFGWQSLRAGGVVLLDQETGLIRKAGRTTPAFRPAAEHKTLAELEAEARSVAVATVQQHYATLIPELKFHLSPMRETGDVLMDPRPLTYLGGTPREMLFYFQRYVNGIPVRHQGVLVTVHLPSMTWTQLSADWATDLDFPDPKQAMTPEQAASAYFEGEEPILIYHPVEDQPAPNAPSTASLAYWMSRPVADTGLNAVDAVSGALLDYDGKPMADRAALEKALSGHPQEAELRFMYEEGLIPAGILPDQALNRGDALQILLGGVNQILTRRTSESVMPFADVAGTSPFYSLAAASVRYGLIGDEETQFNAERPMTRAVFALWLSRVLRPEMLLVARAPYGDLGELSLAEQAAVQILYEKGILDEGEAFRGSEPITTGEASRMLLRFIHSQLDR